MASSTIAPEDFPILCEVCLGESPFLRMTKEPHGKACKICERPFMVFRWRPGPKARFKKTEVCPTCAKLKNVCQTCVLDLQFGLPVQVRDTVLEEEQKVQIPDSDVGRLWIVEQHEKAVQLQGANPYSVVSDSAAALQNLSKLRRGAPYYARNLPHLCSFYAAGKCNRGDSCPYRHEMPQTGELAKQNIKDRYFGQNDPVANKLLGRLNKPTEKAQSPSDLSITTLWVGGVDIQTTEEELRSIFSKFGEVASIRLVLEKSCAFVTFATRSGAEAAAESLWDKLVIRNHSLRIAWGKRGGSKELPPPPGMTLVDNPNANKFLSAPSAPSASVLPPPPGMRGSKPFYPSMDPRSLSAKVQE